MLRCRLHSSILFPLILALAAQQAQVGGGTASAQLPAKGATSGAAAAQYDFSAVSAAINTAIEQKKLPGAVVLIGHDGRVVFEQAYGVRKLAGEIAGPSDLNAEPMTTDTIFDMASMTKVLVTATAVMQLYEEHLFGLDDPVVTYLPEFGVNGKEHVTIRELLTHYSGLPPDVDLKDAWGLAAPDKAEGMRRAMNAKLDSTPGTKFVYSDINFMVLGALVEKLSGERLDDYAQHHIFAPLGTTHTRFLPVSRECGALGPATSTDRMGRVGGEPADQFCWSGMWNRQEWAPNIAPTQHDDQGTAETNPDFDHLLRGTVHDPTTRRMGGVAGQAGVFSTAHDVSLFAQALLDKLLYASGPFPLQQATLLLMTHPEQPTTAEGGATVFTPDGTTTTGVAQRGLGWDINSAYSRPRGSVFPTVYPANATTATSAASNGIMPSFGHTGFTGTSLWIDPASDSYVIQLANSVHPLGNPSISPLRGELANEAARALLRECGVTPECAPVIVKEATPLAAIDTPSTGTISSADPLPHAEPAAVPVVDARYLQIFTAAELQKRIADLKAAETGIDVLEATNFRALKDLAAKHGGHLRIGLLTNQTGVDAQGRRTIDVLRSDVARAAGIELVRLFSPEHGLSGKKDSASIGEEVDAASGLKVVSLYGAKDADKRPKPEDLKDLDAVVIDLQDAGARFYTYETVLGYFLEASACQLTVAGRPLEIVVLDRPDPIGGEAVEGPVSDPPWSYINYSALPLRHGMTLGELAQYFADQPQSCTGKREGETRIGLDATAELTVIPMQGWRRGEFFDQTGVRWVNPSPNLRSVDEAVLYPALGMLDYSNISVGRGTETPFEVFGAGAMAATKRFRPRNRAGSTAQRLRRT